MIGNNCPVTDKSSKVLVGPPRALGSPTEPGRLGTGHGGVDRAYQKEQSTPYSVPSATSCLPSIEDWEIVEKELRKDNVYRYTSLLDSFVPPSFPD